MRTLFVLRHAKAERDSDSGRDFDRPLAGRGWDDAERIGREMRARGYAPDAVLASPARRAAETVEALTRGFGPLHVEYDPGIYNASVARLLEILNAADDAAQLLLVGHNPGLENLILWLAGNQERLADGLPTAALAVLEFPATEWRGVREKTGRLADLLVPRHLAG